MSSGGWVGTIISGLLLLSGSAFAYAKHRWLSRAVFVQGTVEEVVGRFSGGRFGGATYAPRVRYTTADGQARTFEEGWSSNPPSYHVGEVVPVAYDPATSRVAIATFKSSFGLAAALICLGVFVGLLTAVFILGSRWVPAAYLRSSG